MPRKKLNNFQVRSSLRRDDKGGAKMIDWIERHVWPWSELRELRRWKMEQLTVESEWDAQAVANELGMQWGAPIRANILPKIVELKNRARRAEEGPAWNPGRFVQLVPYQDRMLGLTADGTVYDIDRYHGCIQVLFESPTRR